MGWPGVVWCCYPKLGRAVLLSVCQTLDIVHGNLYPLCMESLTRQKLSEAVKRREVVEHICAECGRPFDAIKIRKYHSRACQVRAYRRRKKEAETLKREK